MGFLKYLKSDDFIKDVATHATLKKLGYSVLLLVGPNIGKIHSSKVIYNFNERFDVYGFDNYVAIHSFVYAQLEQQNNIVYPSLHERKFWENKAYMHEYFEKLHISQPRTFLYHSRGTLIKTLPLAFPFLIKEEHSCSSNGLHKINSLSELKELLTESFCQVNDVIIVQELVDMRKDLRVIIVGDEVVHFYWRINPNDEWHPTSSRYGSYISFENFPEKWRQYMVDVLKRLELTHGAFDITWRNDDIDQEPLILEVSPNYQVNPWVDMKRLKCSYGEFKHQIRLFGGYNKRYIEAESKIHSQYIKELMLRSKRHNELRAKMWVG